MIPITKYSSLPRESATHHQWGTILGVPRTGRFAGRMQTCPCWGCGGVGAQPHSTRQEGPGKPAPGRAAGCRARISPSVGQHELLLSRAVCRKQQGLCCGWSPPTGRACPRQAGEPPRRSEGLQNPSLRHRRAWQAALAGGGMWGEHSRTCISNLGLLQPCGDT